MDSNEFSGLPFFKRFSKLGVVGVAIILGLISIFVSFYFTAEKVQIESAKEQAIHDYSESWGGHSVNLEVKLKDINERLQQTMNPELREYLLIQKQEIEEQIEKSKEYEKLKDKYLKPSSSINFSIFPTAHAQTTNEQTPVKKHHILWSILGLLAFVYLGALYSLFLSSVPRNIELATDLVKTLTGFYIGIATTVLA